MLGRYSLSYISSPITLKVYVDYFGFIGRIVVRRDEEARVKAEEAIWRWLE
jgi:hypothetical protein